MHACVGDRIPDIPWASIRWIHVEYCAHTAHDSYRSIRMLLTSPISWRSDKY